ncbi:hypothetical protein [Sulfurimonas sp. HSL-1716]|uniref:hypothetical protein n=1 Tax=Hydrocurvibacter sulfurireducens TaxID=3131937 RepID=UPI0031FA26E6
MMTRFIGIPYKDRGRTFTGADCYGVLVLWYEHILGINIPDVAVDTSDVRGSFTQYLHEISSRWERIDAPEPNCAVAMAMNEEHPKLVTHFGVMIDYKTMLHSHRGAHSHIVKVDSPLVKNIIKGFYRWRG